MIKINSTKLLGIAGTVLGIGATLISSYVNEKQQEETIDRKVNEAIAKLANEEGDKPSFVFV